jgi:predicted transcriptional regulator
MIDDKTLHILNQISESPALSQRALASESGVSVGLVNLIIKRLLHTGHIKVGALNKKKVQYLLTPKGFLEKTRRSYSYIASTVNVFKEYRERLTTLIESLEARGHRRFALLGRGEIADLAEMALSLAGSRFSFRYVTETDRLEPDELVLDCRFNGRPTSNVGVSVLEHFLSPATRPLKNGRRVLAAGRN